MNEEGQLKHLGDLIGRRVIIDLLAPSSKSVGIMKRRRTLLRRRLDIIYTFTPWS
jgi:hypothetical protein